MEFFINDTTVTCAENTTLQHVLQQQNIPLINIAVALDETVIPKAQWNSTIVTEGCRIMIIRAVQGG